MKSVCVFCGSSMGSDPMYRDVAIELGAEIGRRKLRLIYGGGNVGLMGVVADAVLEAGGKVVGVIPESMVGKEIEHRGLTELIVVSGMHKRKVMMSDLADGFIALPGGYGTLDELSEVLCWTQLGAQAKPCGVLNVAGYYDSLLAFLDRAARERFLGPEHRALLLSAKRVPEMLDALEAWKPVPVRQWLSGR